MSSVAVMVEPLRRVVLTGAGGLIGRAIFPLLPADWDVLRTDLEANNGVGALDVTDPDACHQVFAGADAVVHLAAGTQDSEAASVTTLAGDLKSGQSEPPKKYKIYVPHF